MRQYMSEAPGGYHLLDSKSPDASSQVQPDRSMRCSDLISYYLHCLHRRSKRLADNEVVIHPAVAGVTMRCMYAALDQI